MPPIFHPFLAYRSLFYPFLVLCAIVVPCWIVFRVYRHRTRKQPLVFRRELLLLSAVVYAAGLASSTLSPEPGNRPSDDGRGAINLRPRMASLTCSPWKLTRGSRAAAFCTRNARGNVMLFFPLGILLPLLWRNLSFWRGMQIALGLSLGIELAQYISSAWGSHRIADANDVILNVFGAFLGLALMSLLRWRPGDRGLQKGHV